MEYRELGQTGISVSRLCYGLLTLSRLQLGLDPRQAARLLGRSFDAGVRFFDTAVLYETDDMLREFLQGVPRDAVVIASKSYDYEYEAMRQTVEGLLSRLHTPYLDLFLLHEQESRLTLKGHSEALRCLQDLKGAGLVRAVGVSTHHTDVVRACALNPQIDVIHPIYNWKGIGILDGTVDDMREAIQLAHDMGKGVYTMKALGGGHLASDALYSLRHVLGFGAIDAVAVGIADERELQFNVAVFDGCEMDEALPQTVVSEKSVHVADWCQGCGRCVSRCRPGAISLVQGRASVDRNACVLCGYCASVCPEFCLKVF